MKPSALILGFLFVYLFAPNDACAQEEYLLIVDVQKKFYENTEMEQRAGEMVRNINDLIGKFEKQNVIYIKAGGKMLTISLKGIKTVPITNVAELDDDLNVCNNNIFTKIEGDAFTLEALNEYLSAKGAEKIIITGLLAEKCVYHTAVGGKEKGYDVYVVPEAILSRSDSRKEKTFRKMTRKGIKILPMDKIVYTP